ncbi:MAG: alkaline phosphatase family protein [Candidatus Omnitrophica bacterium]|nr:alkaline phosphatase family protein [Candidatus Omnitrophota bacterium]MDD5552858.1 alkaline phosphatase family protein [Candidatus Omnitrophota bacterium]
MDKNKVFVIGLDGVSFRLIKRWISDGQLPALRSLMENGCYSELESVYPPLTPAAWTSFYTGKNPGKHGLFDYQYRQEGSYAMLPSNSRRIQSDSLWKILSGHGKNVGVINVPMTYPAEKVNGFMITGLFTPNFSDLDKTDFVYPASLKEEIRAHIGKYRIYPAHFYTKGNIEELINDYCALIEQRVETTLYFLRTRPWDFLMTVINETDHIQHQLWHLLDPEHPDFDEKESEKYRDVFLKVYRKVDDGIARMLKLVDAENTNIIIMSDHGLGPVYKWINLNTWLLREGYISIRKTPLSRLKYLLFSMGFTPANVYRLLLRLKKNRRAKTGDIAGGKRVFGRFFLNENDINWAKTKAYSLSHMGQVNINLKGREPQGTVLPKDYDETISRLKDELRKTKFIAQILTKNELFSGPCVEGAADLYLKAAHEYCHVLGGAAFISNRIIERSYGNSATHRIDGIFIASGPAISRRDPFPGKIRILDIAANILYMMGLPVPTDFDGKIIDDIYGRDHLSRNKPQYSEACSGQKSEASGASSSGLTEDEIAATREMLKKLGYVKE